MPFLEQVEGYKWRFRQLSFPGEHVELIPRLKKIGKLLQKVEKARSRYNELFEQETKEDRNLLIFLVGEQNAQWNKEYAEKWSAQREEFLEVLSDEAKEEVESLGAGKPATRRRNLGSRSKKRRE